jgi:molecular chaperone GrpE (heat shock protein)
MISDLERQIHNEEVTLVAMKQKLAGMKMRLTEEKRKNTEPEYHIATTLHSLLCIHDGCNWFTEHINQEDNWDAVEHGRYLKKARKLISCEHEVIPEAIEMVLSKLLSLKTPHFLGDLT